jgi:hypothetical protein
MGDYLKLVESELKTLSEDFQSSFRMKPEKVLKKVSIDSIFKTSDNEYKVVGFGQKSNAYRDFEIEDKNGNEFQMRVTSMGASSVVLTKGKSLNFGRGEDITRDIKELK